MDNPRSNAGIRIVPFSGEYIDSVTEIEKNCFSSEGWSREMFVDLLSNPLAVYLVALSDGVTVGYAGMYHILSEGQVMNIAVSPEYRHRGIAMCLFEALTAYAEENGIEYFTLEVRDSNAAAKALYEKLGFETVGVRENYYSAPRENALLMTKEL